MKARVAMILILIVVTMYIVNAPSIPVDNQGYLEMYK